MNYEQVFQLATSIYKSKDRLYASTWKEWRTISLLDIAASKARRAVTYYEDANYQEANEEALDAINYLNFAVQNISNIIVQLGGVPRSWGNAKEAKEEANSHQS